MNQLTGVVNALITPLTGTAVALLNAITRGLNWFMTNPLYAIGGLYVIAVALRGGSFKAGKASTEVKK